MIPSIFEKLGYVAAMVALYLGGNASLLELSSAGPDLVFAGLFLAAFLKTRELPESRIP
ncbi:hypothetical protein [Singulisphaera sp. PoT]|uniref:hypothetical protein n=1 Tax=Singulisphaera sp. PoT TaxID=3411797 RepID=UPI003BF5CBC6